MNRIDIEYNTERAPSQYPEYGRSIQEMIQHALTIESLPQRQKTVEAIVGLMITLSPSNPNRNMDDFREKLWNHVFAIANYELGVKPPPGVNIVLEEDNQNLSRWATQRLLPESATMAAASTPSFKKRLRCQKAPNARALRRLLLPT